MLSKVFHTHFLHNFSKWQGGFSQNESSAWNGTGFINIEYAQGLKFVVAGCYAVTLQSEVLSFPESEKYHALDSQCTVWRGFPFSNTKEFIECTQNLSE